MKTKSEIKPLDNQKAFTLAKHGMLKHRQKSFNEDNTKCAYRGAEGARCAVGFMVPDEIINRHNNTVEVTTLLGIPGQRPDPSYKGRLPDRNFQKRLGKVNPSLLHRLQSIHDRMDSPRWERELLATADEFGLDFDLEPPLCNQ